MNNKRFKLIGMLLGCSFVYSLPSYAASTSDADHEAQLESAIQKVTDQTAELQQEVKSLRAELSQVKAQKQRLERQQVATDTTTPHTSGTAIGASPKPVNATSTNQPPLASQTSTVPSAQDAAKHYRLGFPVTTSPYMGIRSAYDASDLIVNYSSMNEDLRLLQRRQSLDHDLEDLGISSAYGPYAIMSGAVEGQAAYIDPYNSDLNGTASSVNLSRAELDTFAAVSPWAQGFMSLSFDNSNFQPQLEGSGDAINNSRIYLQRGFLTIGNLDRSPLYLTMGQMYVPFGDYANYMLSNPSTKALARTTARAALLGLSTHGLYASGYAYSGSSADTSNDINEFGGNLGYKFSGAKVGGNFGAGMISNIADSSGMQNTGLSTGFEGFGETSSTEEILNKVPAADAHGELDIGKLSLISEFILPTRSFNIQDLMFNNSGAKPRAWHAEGDYTFTMLAKPSVLGFAYDESWQSLALAIPKNSYTGIFSISIWKNTIESLEFRHDVNYPATDVSGGRCESTDGSGTSTFCLNTPAGGQQNMVTGQIGVYF
jgi:hypothetical protein